MADPWDAELGQQQRRRGVKNKQDISVSEVKSIIRQLEASGCQTTLLAVLTTIL